MGIGSSKEEEGVLRRGGSTSSLRSSKRLSRSYHIENIAESVRSLKQEIERFSGHRDEGRFAELQTLLASESKNLQEIKAIGKKKEKVRCDQVLDDIKICFRLLEARVSINENNLDLAAIESHSFVNQKFVTEQPAQTKEQLLTSARMKTKFGQINSVDDLEEQTEKLERDIRNAIELEDTKQFIVLEKKIQLLYVDLEMIQAEVHTPLHERKEAIGIRLIKCNNKIKKAKKSLDKHLKASVQSLNSRNDGLAMSKPKEYQSQASVNVFSIAEEELEELEVRALTFEGFPNDKTYKELEQRLERHWTTIYTAEEFTDDDRTRKENIVARSKNTLKELRLRAQENQTQTKALGDIQKVEKDMHKLKTNIEKYEGHNDRRSYIELDQNARELWAKLSEVKEPNEHVRRNKNRAIESIQSMLKVLYEKAENKTQRREILDENIGYPVLITTSNPLIKLPRQDAMDEDIIQSQLLKQVEEFQNHWNQLSYNIDAKQLRITEKGKHVSNIFTIILNEMTNLVKDINRTDMDAKLKRSSRLSNPNYSVEAQVIKNTEKIAPLSDLKNNEENEQTTSFSISLVHDQRPKPNAEVTSNHQLEDVDQVDSNRNISQPINKNSLATESTIKTSPMTQTISEIQRMHREIKNLTTEIKETPQLSKPEHAALENRLQNYNTALNAIGSTGNGTVSNIKQKAIKSLNEALQHLNKKKVESDTVERVVVKMLPPRETSQRVTTIERISTSKALQEVMDVDAEIQYLSKQINSFDGITKNTQYIKIEKSLLENLKKLESIDAGSQNNIKISIQEIKQQIHCYQEELLSKLTNNQAQFRSSTENLTGSNSSEARRQVSHEIKTIVEQVQKLKLQIERFNGIYKGVLYNQIEDDLNTCKEKLEHIDTNSNEKFSNAKTQTIQKIHQYLTILEAKSMQMNQNHTVEQYSPVAFPQGETHVQNSPLQKTEHKQNDKEEEIYFYVSGEKQRSNTRARIESSSNQINSLRQRLTEIKASIEEFSGSYKDSDYNKIVNDLLMCNEELLSVHDGENESVRESKTQHIKYVDDLLRYFEDKVGFVEPINHTNRSSRTLVYNSKLEDEIQSIQQGLEQVKPKILSFVGDKKSKEYRDMDESLITMIVKLESITTGDGDFLREKQHALHQEIQYCIKVLEEKASGAHRSTTNYNSSASDQIQQILHENNLLTNAVLGFTGNAEDKSYVDLDEKLIELVVKLDNIDIQGNPELARARVNVFEELQRNMKALEERVQQGNANVSETVKFTGVDRATFV